MAYNAKIGGAISASATKSTIDFKKCKHLFIINDGANSVFIALAQDTPAGNLVDVNDFELKAGEHMGLDSEISDYGFIQGMFICNAGESASVRYLGWY
jgi:hypothetical protein